MATGDVRPPVRDAAEPPAGEVEMASGRLSIARRVQQDQQRLPFNPSQLARVDEALALSTRSTGLEFAIYLGDLGDDTRQCAEEIHAELGDRASEGVLIAISPQRRHAEIVTGDQASRRIPDRSCQLAMMSMVASLKEGELIDGMLGGLRMLSDSAGTAASSEH